VVEPEAVVLVGGSQTLTSMDPEVVAEVTRRPSIMLAVEAALAVPLLEELLREPAFRGHVILEGGTLGMVSPDPARSQVTARTLLDHRLAPFVEQWEVPVLRAADVALAFRRPGFPSPWRAALESARGELRLPPAGLRRRPDRFFEFEPYVASKWEGVDVASLYLPPDPPPGAAARVVERLREGVEELRRRGGSLELVRYPISGRVGLVSRSAAPRAEVWDRLVQETGLPAFHFEDDFLTSTFAPLDDLHLVPDEAEAFTAIALGELARQGFPPPR
jgi:hypothetical protein